MVVSVADAARQIKLAPVGPVAPNASPTTRLLSYVLRSGIISPPWLRQWVGRYSRMLGPMVLGHIKQRLPFVVLQPRLGLILRRSIFWILREASLSIHFQYDT